MSILKAQLSEYGKHIPATSLRQSEHYSAEDLGIPSVFGAPAPAISNQLMDRQSKISASVTMRRVHLSTTGAPRGMQDGFSP
jgi:hypothetical protein